MSGFLQRLGERAVGRPGIVPRALTRFESAQAIGAEPAPARATTREVPGAEAASSLQGSLRPVSHEPGRLAAPRRTSPEPNRIDRHDGEPAGQAVPRLGPQIDGHRPPLAAAPITTLVGETSRPAPEDSGPGGQPITTEEPAATARQRRDLAPTLAATHTLPVPAPLGDSTSLSRRPTSTPPAAPAPEPIQVTIGRVEVRAVFAPTPPVRPAARAAPAAPSLQDYLQARGRS